MSAEASDLGAGSQGWPEGRPLDFGDSRASYDAAMREVTARLASAPGESYAMLDPGQTSRGTLGLLVAAARARRPDLVDQPSTTISQRLGRLSSEWQQAEAAEQQNDDPADKHLFLGD